MIPKDLLSTWSSAIAQPTTSAMGAQNPAASSIEGGLALTTLQNAMCDLQQMNSRPPREKAIHLFDQLRSAVRSSEEKGTLLIQAISNGIDNINAQDRIKGTGMEKWSLLHHAVNMGNTAVLSALLDAAHIRIHTQDKAGSSPLHHAAQRGDVAALTALLEKHRHMHPDDATSLRSFVNSTNGAYRTPMHLAATSAHPAAAMQLLFDAGAEVDPTTRSGMSTPLSYAVKAYEDSPERSLEAVRWLIAKGANASAPLLIHKTNRTAASAEARAAVPGNRTTPLEIARECHWDALVVAMDPTTSPGDVGSASLRPDGTLDFNRPIEDLFRAVVAAKAGPERVAELARLFCDDVYQNVEEIYDSSDAYYTCKELRREGRYNDLDHDDLTSSSRERVCNRISDWLDKTAPLAGKEIQSSMEMGVSDLDEVIEKVRDFIELEFRSFALTVMKNVALEWVR